MVKHGPRRRCPPWVSAYELFGGLVYHALQSRGTLATHMGRLSGKQISDSALSQRRATLPWAVFEAVMEAALRPLADADQHPQAFYAGLRLVGLDGTHFSCANTPRLLRAMTKAASRRLEAAFAKLGAALLVELGTHAPLAAAVAQEGEGELALAGRLLERLPPESLLLADRLYGTGAFLVRLQKAAARVGQPSAAFLLRVSRQPRSRLVQALADGSALVELTPSRDLEDRPTDGSPLRVREIRARVRRPGCAWSEVRLWTSLLDAKAHPALELVALYARRWEWEVFAREMKIDLRASGAARPLASHTLHTAAQEIAALFLAMALLARTRLAGAARAGVEPLRVSFGQTLALLGSLWQLLSVGADLLTPVQTRLWVERLHDELALAVLPPRRRRTCPRALRQPVTNYPRLTKNTQQKGDFDYEMEPLR